MENTCARLLKHCLEGTPWLEALIDEIVNPGRPDLQKCMFRDVVERLSDLFEPRLCDVYAELMSEVIARVIPDDLHAPHLVARYKRIRQARRIDHRAADAEDVFVLSRVTLGADIAVTSVILDGVKRAFPRARIHFVGPRKSWELFAGDPRLHHVPVEYGRGSTMRERLAVWPQVRELVCRPRSVVIDPDSRMTQLGLLPICLEEDYYFFESRAYASESREPLSTLASRWVGETLGVPDAKAYFATGLGAREFATTVSLGVGENLEKRVGGSFEADLLKQLPRPVLIDKGAGGEEADRVERAVRDAGPGVETWDGSFAGFASHIARSRLYVGYDSAGGHAAAACGVPLLSIFAGAPSDRFFDRWHPAGPGPIRVVRVQPGIDAGQDVLTALDELTRH